MNPITVFLVIACALIGLALAKTVDILLVTHRLRRPAMDETGAELIVSGTAPSAQRSGFAWCEQPVC